MQTVVVFVRSLDGKAEVPKYATEGSAGFDLVAAGEVTIMPGAWTLIGTSLAMQVPEGFELQIRSRSGMARKGLIVLNQPGTLDSDYRGEVGVLLFNVGQSPQTISIGDRIAQGIISPVVQAQFEGVEKLDETERGSGGYGSTGK